MKDKRIVLSLPDKMVRFLDEMSRESGMDRTNLIRMRLWEWMVEERENKAPPRRSASIQPPPQP